MESKEHCTHLDYKENDGTFNAFFMVHAKDTLK